MSNNTSAVTTVTPIASARGGRKPLVLKNGQPWAEAKKAAAAAVSEAKVGVRTAEGRLKELTKTRDGYPKQIEKLNKEVAKTEAALAKTPKDAAAKQAVKDAKGLVAGALKQQKAAAKDVEAATKAVEKAKAALAKAEAGLAKVVDSKPQKQAA